MLHQPIKDGIKQSRQTFRSVLVSQIQEVDFMDPLQFYRAGKDLYSGERTFWADPDHEMVLAGNGVAHILSNESDDPFHDCESAWNTLLESSIITPESRISGTGPVLFGGFTFDVLRKKTKLWQNFGNARLVIPKFLLTCKDGKAWLTTTVLVQPNDDIELYTKLETEREELLRVFLNETGRGAHDQSGTSPEVLTMEELAVPEWLETITDVTQEMVNGDLEKVVLAREMRIHATDEFSSDTILDRLLSAQPMSYVFALDAGSDCFLGATPERLVKKDGQSCLSTCLAGTIRRGATIEEDEQLGYELLHDAKNLHEHEIVVRIIQRALNKVCESIQLPEGPQLYKVRDVQHLYTPVVGTVRTGVSIFNMVEELHPTPALGGYPRDLAMAVIREHEPFERGLYGAPIGWADSFGNGEFAVAIRSALLQGEEASLFAGCGIVLDSDPQHEYKETHLKFKPMTTALGGTWRDTQ